MVGKADELKTAYKTLGVEDNAHVDDIKEAYQQRSEGLQRGMAKLGVDPKNNRAVATPEMIAAATKQKKELDAAYEVISKEKRIEVSQPQKETTPVARSASPHRQQVSAANAVAVKDTTEKAPSFDKNKDYYAMLGIDKSNKEINQREVVSKYSVASIKEKYSVKELNEAAAVLKNPETRKAYDAARAPAQDKAVPDQDKATPTVAVKPRFPRIAAMREGLEAIGAAMLGAKSGPPSTPSKSQNATKGQQI